MTTLIGIGAHAYSNSVMAGGGNPELLPATSAGGPFTTKADWPSAGTGSRDVVAGKLEVTQSAAWTDGVWNSVLDEDTAVLDALADYTVTVEIEMGDATLVQFQLGTGGYANQNYSNTNISTDSTVSKDVTLDAFANLGITLKASTASTFKLISASVKKKI